MVLRLALFLVLIFSAFFLPLPIVLFLFAVLAAIFSGFWESILVGIILDSLYFSPVLFSKFNFGFFTISFIFLVFVLEKFKYLVQTKNLTPRLVVGSFAGLLFYIVVFFVFN